MARSRFAAIALTALATAASASPAHAQWLSRMFGGGGGGDCGCGPASAPVYQSAAYSPCNTVSACSVCPVAQPTVQLQPVVQQVYQTVPVTEYQKVKHTVRRAVPEVKYVSQDYTEYNPVTETKVVNVPTTQYQDVTEYQQVQRQTGYWMSRMEPNIRQSPCSYDGRPGFMGWMNRTGYELKNAFIPPYSVKREFCPQTVVQQVPVTRRVAIQGTRQVTYNVTNYVAERKSRQVAVNTTRWVDEEVDGLRPVTVMKTMAVGSQVAYMPVPIGGTATALAPQPDSIGSARRTDRTRSANRDESAFDDETDPNRFKRTDPKTNRPISYPVPARQPVPQPTADREPFEAQKPTPKSFSPPSIARAGRWVARTPDPAPTRSTSDGTSLADVDR